MSKYKEKVKRLKENIYALGIALKRKDVPWYAKAVIAIVVGYALSPIDLIPDFIPVIGLLDDLLLLPLGIVLSIKLIPKSVWEECRQEATANPEEMKPNKVAAAIIIVIWVVILFAIGKAIYLAVK